MAKPSVIYYCKECGHETSRWAGQCPGCKQWNTMVEGEKMVAKPKAPNKSSIIVSGDAKAQRLNSVEVDTSHRINTGMKELNRVLGGGLMQASVVLLSGDPGIGKSTLLLQICNSLAKEGIVMYASGEESRSQIKSRADRICQADGNSVLSDNVWVLATNDIEKIEQEVSEHKPAVLIVDSVQTIYRQQIESAPGSTTQIKEVASSLTYLAKNTNTSVILVGHVTKDGNLAGPKTLEHLVDTVLYFEGDRYESYRLLRTNKNRFGSTNEIGIFEMCDIGFREVDNPSGLFISEDNKKESGCCVTCAIEGTRPLLAEVQALVCSTSFGNPLRTPTGVDRNRLTLLAAVLEKKANMPFSDQDIYLNVIGGFKINERAADLAIAMALVSALKNVPLGKETAFIGEMSLTGEVRPVSHIEKRIQECERMGFSRVLIPKGSMAAASRTKFKNIEVVPVISVIEAIQITMI